MCFHHRPVTLWWISALHIIPVYGGRVRFYLLLRRLLRGPQVSRAVVAAIFDVVILGQRRNHGGAASDLADAVEDDFGASIVGFHGSQDFDGASGEAANVANIFQFVGENHHREGAGHFIFTKIEEVDALEADSDSQNFSSDAFGFAYVLAGFLNGDAIGGREEGNGGG